MEWQIDISIHIHNMKHIIFTSLSNNTDSNAIPGCPSFPIAYYYGAHRRVYLEYQHAYLYAGLIIDRAP